MKEKDWIRSIEILVPYIIKKIKEDGAFQNAAKITQAKVVSVSESSAVVQLPYDKNTFTAPIKTTDVISAGDNVFLLYWGDLKNAHVIFKN